MRRRGFSLVELLIVVAIIGVLLAVAIPHFITMRLGADENAVIREVQTIHQAQIQYSSQFGKYAGTIAELGPSGANLVPESLASGEKNGYLFTMTSRLGGYAVHANPKVFGSTGRRTFYLDESGVVHQNWGSEPATNSSPELR